MGRGLFIGDVHERVFRSVKVYAELSTLRTTPLAFPEQHFQNSWVVRMPPNGSRIRREKPGAKVGEPARILRSTGNSPFAPERNHASELRWRMASAQLSPFLCQQRLNQDWNHPFLLKTYHNNLLSAYPFRCNVYVINGGSHHDFHFPLLRQAQERADDSFLAGISWWQDLWACLPGSQLRSSPCRRRLFRRGQKQILTNTKHHSSNSTFGKRGNPQGDPRNSGSVSRAGREVVFLIRHRRKLAFRPNLIAIGRTGFRSSFGPWSRPSGFATSESSTTNTLSRRTA
jgi:hypothetical protein